jgi:anaerobic selenocysteine-containing dehydrogenase
MSSRRIVHRICTLCEATCGIDVNVEGNRVLSVRGDKLDPFSQGYICPKAHGMKQIHEDPDRLRRPLRRLRAGGWEEISWQEAYRFAGERLRATRDQHGADSIGVYLGNPSAHSLHCMVYIPVLVRALGTKQRFSASTVDQFPKMVSAGLMFGDGLTIPIPDLDRTSYLMILGGNPMASNGSLMTAPNLPKRLAAIRERGGKIVVIDPRRSETAEVADEHLFIRPGTDAYLLLAMVNVMFEEGLAKLGRAESLVVGTDTVRTAIADFSPERVAGRCGVDASTIRRLTREFCGARAAACYGRIGTTCAEFGTLASWAVDLVNVFSGNLDREGGAMFARSAAIPGWSSDKPGGRGVSLHRWKSRVKGLPEVFGELPTATLADEIETPGAGQIRSLVTIAGNPCVSTQQTERLSRALSKLDFMVSIDFYLNETTRWADLILPPTSALEHDTYDIALYRLTVRDFAKYSDAALPKDPSARHDWEILASLAAEVMGMGGMTPAQVDDFVLAQVVQKAFPADGSATNGLTHEQVVAALGSEPGPHRSLDLLLRTGPYGDRFGSNPDGLSLAKLRKYPHGLDLGPLKRQLPGLLRTRSGKIELAPELMLSDLGRLRARMADGDGRMVLIGRRHLRSNNSWCHNLPALMKGRDRCTLLVSSADAARLRLQNGGRAKVSSRVGSVIAPVEVTDAMMPGVVSLPHGWGHDVEGVRLRVAREQPGVNSNVLADPETLDVPSGNGVLNGIPVTIEAVS